MPPSVATRLPAQILERAQPPGVLGSHRQHLAELVIGNGDGERRSPRRRVLDAAQPDIRVAARDRLIDRREGDHDESRRTAHAARDERRDLDVEADDLLGIGGIGLDERRAALRVAGPAQLRRS